MHIKGVTPSSVRTESYYKKIKVIEFNEKFDYYNIRILDPRGQEIPSQIVTDDFKVDITELNKFQNKMNDLTSKGGGFVNLKTFAEQLHENGLKDEANELADLLLKLPTQECKVNYYIFAAIFIGVLLIGGWVGRKMGYDAGYEEGYDECIATKSDDEGD